MIKREVPYETPPEWLHDQINMLKNIHRRREDYVKIVGDAERRIGGILRREFDGDKELTNEWLPKVLRADENKENAKYKENDVCVYIYDYLKPLILMWQTSNKIKNQVDKVFTNKIKEMAIFGFSEKTPGIGDIGLAQIVAEVGDFWLYDRPDKVWKRMGLACIDGQAQRRIAGKTKADAERATLHGFSPKRRKIMKMVSKSLMMQNKIDGQPGKYRQAYLERKEYELKKNIKLIHADNRALRHIAKMILYDLWLEWPNYYPVQVSQSNALKKAA